MSGTGDLALKRGLDSGLCGLDPELRIHCEVVPHKPPPQDLRFPTAGSEQGAPRPDSRRGRAGAHLKERGTQASSPAPGTQASSPAPGSCPGRLRCAPLHGLGQLAERHPARRAPRPRGRAWCPWGPESVCTERSSAPSLPTSRVPTAATASRQLGHPPRTPPLSPVPEPRTRFTSVHLVVWVSLLPRSDYPSAGHQRLHPEVATHSCPGRGFCSSSDRVAPVAISWGTANALRVESPLLRCAVPGPPDPVFVYVPAGSFITAGHCSHPSPSSTLPERLPCLHPCPVLQLLQRSPVSAVFPSLSQ